MRRLSRLRGQASAGFASQPSMLSNALRAPAAAIISTASGSRHDLEPSPVRTQTRHLSNTPVSRSTSTSIEPQPATLQDQPPVTLVYPQGISVAPPPSEVTDPSYKPADSAEGLEEVGGLADWWDQPGHWSSAFAPRAFGCENDNNKVTDPFVLEVFTRRAVVEALVLANYAGADGKRVDRIFSSVGGAERLRKIVEVELAASEDEGKRGEVTLKNSKDWVRVWTVLRSVEEIDRKERQRAATKAWLEQQKREKLAKEAEEKGEAVEATPEPATQAQAEAPKESKNHSVSPDAAQELVRSWDKGWRKAELRDPVVKYFFAKRIQQLTGHRIPDGKLHGIKTIDGLLKQLVEPPKPKKLAELVEAKDMFKDLPNVRVFPRRVTPIDKEKMVGRWKIIVRELEKRELPVIGTGDYGEPIEKKWIEGRV